MHDHKELHQLCGVAEDHLSARDLWFAVAGGKAQDLVNLMGFDSFSVSWFWSRGWWQWVDRTTADVGLL